MSRCAGGMEPRSPSFQTTSTRNPAAGIGAGSGGGGGGGGGTGGVGGTGGSGGTGPSPAVTTHTPASEGPSLHVHTMRSNVPGRCGTIHTSLPTCSTSEHLQRFVQCLYAPAHSTGIFVSAPTGALIVAAILMTGG